ncbi:unnamed protein product, partial [Linum tenue]
ISDCYLKDGQARLFWCVPRAGVAVAQLQANLDYACGQPDVDCGPIQPGGTCYEPNTVASHAAFAMNLYYQVHGKKSDCDFSGTGTFTNTDPSKFTIHTDIFYTHLCFFFP